jgi:hypothetical protein
LPPVRSAQQDASTATRCRPTTTLGVLVRAILRAACVTATAAGAALLAPAAPALAGHEHLVEITNPHTGEVTCQYVARGATPDNDNFHDRAHTGPGQEHRGGQARLEKEANAQGCTTTRGQQTPEVEPH